MSFSAAASRRQPFVGGYRSALLQSTPTNSSPKFVIATACVQLLTCNCLLATTRNRLKVVLTAGIAVLTAQRS
jgi:hypothetical protein